MIVAANPYAVHAGANILAKGGTAADAMIATQAILGLVEPQSSGLGGGAFLLWYDAKSKRLFTLDGRETAPRLATERLFQDETGKPIRFFEAVIGGKSVGVPGVPALMLEAHNRWGKLNWPELFVEGIDLAEKGFVVSPRLASLIQKDKKNLQLIEKTNDYFFPNGKSVRAGDILKNLPYAKTLRTLALEQTQSFYHGEIAVQITSAVQKATLNAGLLDEIDLRNYTIRERRPVCSEYNDYKVCGMGPPSSGAITISQILGMLKEFNLKRFDQNSFLAWHLIGEASKLAFADRDKYIADSDFVHVPVKELLDKNYLKTRASQIQIDKVISPEDIKPGDPEPIMSSTFASDDSMELPSTSHISIVDQYGNALSMTTTIENLFGSRLMTEGGFLLNNEMTDFSFRSELNGLSILNKIEPAKRPRSSMSPTIVFKDEKPDLIVGSPGGSRIIGYVAAAIIAHVDWGMNIQDTVAMPHLINNYGVFELEKVAGMEKQLKLLSNLGHKTKLRDLNSGLHGIVINDTGLSGGADPRREGLVLGN